MTSFLKNSPKNLISLTYGTLATQISEADVTDVLASDWWKASSESVGKGLGMVGKGSGMVEKARGKKAGRGGWGKKKKEGRGGWGDDANGKK